MKHALVFLLLFLPCQALRIHQSAENQDPEKEQAISEAKCGCHVVNLEIFKWTGTVHEGDNLSEEELIYRKSKVGTWKAGLGNDLHQLAEGLLEAEELGNVTTVSGKVADRIRMEMKPNLTQGLFVGADPVFNEIQLKAHDPSCCVETRMSLRLGERYGLQAGPQFFREMNTRDQSRVLNTYVRPMLFKHPSFQIGEDMLQRLGNSLVIHLRSGDGLPKYQGREEPTEFYTDALERSGLHDMIVVTRLYENATKNHPALESLKALGADVISTSQRADWSILAHCSHLVHGMSTYALTAGMLNKNLKHAYTIGSEDTHHLEPEYLKDQSRDIGFVLPSVHTTVHMWKPNNREWVVKESRQ